jgi:hypothetical protein
MARPQFCTNCRFQLYLVQEASLHSTWLFIQRDSSIHKLYAKRVGLSLPNLRLEPHQPVTARRNCSRHHQSRLVQENVKNYMRPPSLTEQDETREKHDQPWLVLSGPVRTVSSCSKDGELHTGWTTTVRCLAEGQILSSHRHLVGNSGAQNSVQRCHRFLTRGYSSQSKMLITYIYTVLRSRTLGAVLHVSYAYRLIKINLLLKLDTLSTATVEKLSGLGSPLVQCGQNRQSRHLVLSCSDSLVLSWLVSVVPALVSRTRFDLTRIDSISVSATTTFNVQSRCSCMNDDYTVVSDTVKNSPIHFIVTNYTNERQYFCPSTKHLITRMFGKNFQRIFSVLLWFMLRNTVFGNPHFCPIR